ncbi:hypothetical protein [Paenibacillus durus]|uniref:Uncharacterized protein n=1 Tax=Paenibacillus durus TaxID=44251 RepID=A0A089HKY4_PAEDU|nr:hypothetical protein [Paenibacillus durus]AIQ11350.1 hypothetical protein PDUR_04610 [Paenibacillus durus]
MGILKSDYMTILAIIVIIIWTVFYIRHRKKVKLFIKNEVEALDFNPDVIFKYKDTLLLLNCNEGRLADIQYGNKTGLYNFYTEHYLADRNRSKILLLNEENNLIIIFYRDTKENFLYNLSDIKEVGIMLNQSSDDKGNGMVRPSLRLTISDVSNPHHEFDWFKFNINLNDEFFQAEFRELEKEVAILRVYAEQAKNKFREEKPTFYIENAPGSIIGNQSNSVINYQSLNEEVLEDNQIFYDFILNEVQELLDNNSKINQGELKKYSQNLKEDTELKKYVADLVIDWLIYK